MPTRHTLLFTADEWDAMSTCIGYFEATPRGGDIMHDGRRDRCIEAAGHALFKAMSPTQSPVPRPVVLTHPQMDAMCSVLAVGNATADTDSDISADLQPAIRSAHQRILLAHNHQS